MILDYLKYIGNFVSSSGWIASLFCAIILILGNRIRGGGWKAGRFLKEKWIGKPLVWVSIVVGICSFLLGWPMKEYFSVISIPESIQLIASYQLPKTIELPNYLMFWTPYRIHIAWAVTYWFWGMWAWGRWFDLNRAPDGFMRPNGPNLFEIIVEFLGFHNDYACMFIRHMMIFPGMLLVNYLMPTPISIIEISFISAIFSIAVLSCYRIGIYLEEVMNKVPYSVRIENAEMMVGFIWFMILQLNVNTTKLIHSLFLVM